MATEEQILSVLNNLVQILSCPNCDTRLRFGDWECPHCGQELDDFLRRWAAHLVDQLAAANR